MEWYWYVIIGLLVINSINTASYHNNIKEVMQNRINSLENTLDKYEDYLMKEEED